MFARQSHSNKKFHRFTLGLATGLVATLATCLPASLFSMDINDVVDLKKANAGDQVILAEAEHEHAAFHLNVDDLKRLKYAGASDELILSLMKTAEAREKAQAAGTVIAPAVGTPAETVLPNPTTTPTTPATSTTRAPQAVSPATPATGGDEVATVTAAAGTAVLELEMLDDPDIDVAVNISAHKILFGTAGQLGGAADPGARLAWRLTAGHRISTNVPAGSYKVQWVDEATVFTVTLDTKSKGSLVCSTAETNLAKAIYLSIFQGENRVNGGRIHVFGVKSSAFAPQPTPPAPNDYNPASAQQVSMGGDPNSPSVTYYNQTAAPATYASEPCAPIGVISSRIIAPHYLFAPTVVYASPARYYAPTYCSNRYTYHAPCYAPHYSAPTYCAWSGSPSYAVRCYTPAPSCHYYAPSYSSHAYEPAYSRCYTPCFSHYSSGGYAHAGYSGYSHASSHSSGGDFRVSASVGFHGGGDSVHLGGFVK